jgi:ribose-phosphate pyrophosphokinase
MIEINLDKNFTPFLFSDIDVKQFDFPSGCEPHVKILKDELCNFDPTQTFRVSCRIRNGNDFLSLLLTIDALKRLGVKDISCFIPYLPFARQDRVMTSGEPLSIKVISDILNAQNLTQVVVYDVHSEVSLALINNSTSISNHFFVNAVLNDKKNYLIVSPDAGAYKKIFKLCQSLGYKKEIVLCNKTRNVSNGNITSVTCAVDDFKGSDLYIVDDICDGGGTFVLLAEELKKRNCGKINLIVSHGIFSKGIEALQGIDHIYTTNSFQDLESTEKLTQIKLRNILLS